MSAELKGDYCIIIDFKKDSPNPERIFQTMSELIKSFQKLDNILIDSIDSNIEPIILLEDVETGSLKTWLKTVLKNTPDEALSNLDWKPAVGQFLVKAKYIILNRLEGKTLITDAQLIEDIQYEILNAAEETKVKAMPNYHPIQTKKLLTGIDDINKSLQYLDKEDSATYQTATKSATFNLSLELSADTLEDLLTVETIENDAIMILKVNKPDYLGDSMWTLKHENKTINARIVDKEWLLSFQQRKVDVRPGDSLKCNVHITVKYGKDMSVIRTVHEIREVIKTINLDDKGNLQLTIEN